MAYWNYPSNYSNGTVADRVSKFFFEYPSYVLNDWMGAGILLLIWLVLFAIMSSGSSRKGLAVSSFITFIFSIYFLRLDIIHPVIPILLIILTIIGALGSKTENY